MTTNKQLQEWLKRFDDGAVINVLTATERQGYWESYTDVSMVELELPDVQIGDLKWCDYFENVEFAIEWDSDSECCCGVGEITLGKKD